MYFLEQLDLRMTVPEFTIRRATEADASGILDCLAAAFEPYRSSYTRDAYSDTVLTPETLSQRLTTMQVFVAFGPGEEIIGTIACAIAGESECHLRGMAVLPQFQGRGTAEGLLKTAEAALSRQGCSRVTLDTTEPLLRAMRFYEKHGYRPSGKVIDFFGMPLHQFVKQL
jgi:ribosomal protein S18 acetylase RimI-like enzyme